MQKDPNMKTRISIAALATMFFVALQGCQMESTVSDGDHSSEKKGGVAFRLSPQNVNVLQSQSLYLQYKVSGPGMDTLTGSAYADTAPTFIPDVPSGTRVVEITALSWSGIATWYGADTIQVNPDQYAFAHVTLHRLANPTGTVVLDISLDSIPTSTDSLRPRGRLDTVWTTQTYHSVYPYSYNSCGSPSWAGAGDSLQVNCTHVIGLPISSDTTWSDTAVHYPVSDTARWCVLTDSGSLSAGDTTSSHASFHCYRFHYEPYTGPVDTIWRDTTIGYPADSSVFCYQTSFDRVFCYRPSPSPQPDSLLAVSRSRRLRL